MPASVQLNVQVIFYSMYSHVYRMAEAVAQGAREVAGANVSIFQVPELIEEASLVRSGAKQARDQFAHIPIATPDQLPQADCILFGTPTRYGSLSAQMQNFLDRTGKLWATGALIGKVAGVFTSTATQHGGQETTIRSFHTALLHHGMVIVGVPYSCQDLTYMGEVLGGSPYGAGTLAGPDGSRQPSERELAIARFQGRHTAQIAANLKAGAAALGAGESTQGGGGSGKGDTGGQGGSAGEGRTIAGAPKP